MGINKKFLLLRREDMANLYGVSKIIIGKWHNAGLIPPGCEFLGKHYWEGTEIEEFEKRVIIPHYHEEWTERLMHERFSYEFDRPPEPRQMSFPHKRVEAGEKGTSQDGR